MKLVIGTRGSELALVQARAMRDALLADPACGVDEVDLRIIKTRGDRILDVTLSRVGGKGLFVKELEQALLDREVDLCVHSLKDMPSDLPDGLALGAIPRREDPRDAWVRPAGAEPLGLDALPAGAIVATASLRRQAQVLARRPDLRVVPVRGNVGTRLDKLDEGRDGMVAMVLACAGLRRLGLTGRITGALEVTDMLPAVGQGALALEVRADDEAVAAAVARLDHPDTRDATRAERALLATLEGSCQVPIAGHARLDGDLLRLDAFVARPDGTDALRAAIEGPRADAVHLGRSLGEHLLERGARAILDELQAADGHG